MKIVKSFRDYYDSACAWDRESVPLYVRKSQTFKTNDIRDPSFRIVMGLLNRMPCYNKGCRWVIGFCGRLYPAYSSSRYSVNKNMFYDIQSLITAAYQAETSYYFTDEASIRELQNNNSNRFSGRLNRWSWNRFVQDRGTPPPNDAVFRFFRAPVFLSNLETVTVNAKLYECNFQTQFDPYTAYQELDMYLSNNLSDQQEPSSEVSDDLKRHYHGFDKKYGFRKRPKGN
jgi:hypothetical protein